MREGFLERGGLWVLGQGFFFLAIAGLGIAYRDASQHPALSVGGLILLLISAVYGIAGIVALGQNLTPLPKPEARARLVQNGIYGVSRHPLYVAVCCAGLGWSLIRHSWPALTVSLALAVFLDAKARREERWLRQKFPEYSAYAKRVRRFLPGIY